MRRSSETLSPEDQELRSYQERSEDGGWALASFSEGKLRADRAHDINLLLHKRLGAW